MTSFTGRSLKPLARKFNYPVVYMKVQRPRRGHYVVTPELICVAPNEMAPDEISETFTRLMERDIKEMPEIWLWSHRRWKHKKPAKALQPV